MTIANRIARRLALLAAVPGLSLAFAAQAQTVVYYHTDALGSVVAVTDASRNVVEENEYEPYGKVVNHALQDGPGYTGHVADAQTGLIYMQQRYYDDDLGEFPTVDPVSANSLGGIFNRYAYSNNNPYRFFDPDGRMPVDNTMPSSSDPPKPECDLDCRKKKRKEQERQRNSDIVLPSRGGAASAIGNGLADGAGSFFRGNYRAIRQIGRGLPLGPDMGVLGKEEFEQVQREGAVLDAMAAEIANNPEARKQLVRALTEAIENAPYDDPYFRGYTFGRFGMGLVLAPFGISAIIGDGLHHVEQGVESPEEVLMRGVYGE